MTRASLHRLLDQLPEAQIDRIAELLDAVRRNDRVAIQLALAPEEPAEDDERKALDEPADASERGQAHAFEDVLAHFHLTPDQLR